MIKIAAALILALAVSGAATAQESVPAPPATEVPPAAKGDRVDRPTSTAEERRAARLDVMFGRLAKTTDERRARRIARHIMRRLNQSGSDTVDYLMARAGDAMNKKSYPQALDLLDGVVRLQPEFAEGWNRRATAHFLAGNYGQSLADIEQVLRLEPRHWGALSGFSLILISMERKSEAVVVMDRALAVHPFLKQVKERRDKLKKEIDGSSI